MLNRKTLLALLCVPLLACGTSVTNTDVTDITDATDRGAMETMPPADTAPQDDGSFDVACANSDEDGDGHRSIRCGGDDCDDNDGDRYPAHAEICAFDPASMSRVNPTHDEDCDPTTYAGTAGDGDHDGDGHVDVACCNADSTGVRHCGDDCADLASASGVSPENVHPSQRDACNGVDDNCNGTIDEGDPGGGQDCIGPAHVCRPGTTRCVAGAIACVVDYTASGYCCGGFDDCDALHTNGCEHDTSADIANCGACGTVCPPVGSSAPACNAGVCGMVCPAGMTDCGGSCVGWDVTHCGPSCHACVAPAGGSTSCDPSGTCVGACPTGFTLVGTGCVEDGTVRPIAPLSTAAVTSQQPTLRWSLGAGTEGAHVALCRDRALTVDCITLDVDGSSARPPAALAPGIWFWQLTARDGGVTGSARSPVWEFTVGHLGAPRDTSWGSTLDVNGDGFPDIAVGAYAADSNAGAVYVYLGSASGLSPTPATTLSGTAGSRFGVSVESAGDVNGDGYCDLLVGAPGVMMYAGEDLLFLGGPDGLSSTPAWTHTGTGRSGFGAAVSGAGDVNGDGYGDVVVGASGSMMLAGEIDVFLGSASGLSMTPATTIYGTPPAAGASTFLGWAVASGDTNGDGFGDVIASAPYASGEAGEVYVYLGSERGLATTPARTIDGQPNSHFGSTLNCAGDVNGDGLADMIASTLGLAPVYVEVFAGTRDGIAPFDPIVLARPMYDSFGWSVNGVGDVNGDGYSDVMVGAEVAGSGGEASLFLGYPGGISGTPATVLAGEYPSSLGWSEHGAGDLDRDGFDDVVIGDTSRITPGMDRAHVFVGNATGLGGTPWITLAGPIGSFFGGDLASFAAPRRRGVGPMCITREAVVGALSRVSREGAFGGLRVMRAVDACRRKRLADSSGVSRRALSNDTNA